MNVSPVKLSTVNSFRRNENLSKPKTVSLQNFKGTNASEPKAEIDSAKLLNAYLASNNVRFAKHSTVSFGQGLGAKMRNLQALVITCKDDDNGKSGEEIGTRYPVSGLFGIEHDFNPNDSTSSDVIVSTREDDNGQKWKSVARTTIKGLGSEDPEDIFHGDKPMPVPEGTLKFSMHLRPEIPIEEESKRVPNLPQAISIIAHPNEFTGDIIRTPHGTRENAQVLTDKKGGIMAVVYDPIKTKFVSLKEPEKVEEADILLTNTGFIEKKEAYSSKTGYLKVSALKNERDKEGNYTQPNKFTPFEPSVPIQKVKTREGGSDGGGTELIIGLEEGRFVPEIIESIEEFQKKIENGEIVLDRFSPAPNVETIQIGMLAGGFGSRAEYANAASKKIMFDKKDGSSLTKGCFRTATGLTPMETSFISLHNAGYLDCSKGNFGIGKNIKFWINDSGKNGGNGSFSVDMYNTMKGETNKNLLILPNDAMSRMPEALKKLNEKINSGDAAMVMIAKAVHKDTARGSLGIMQIDNNGVIKEFAEKPKNIKDDYLDGDMCYANTFQFVVSKEALQVLNDLEVYLARNDGKKKEARDWSKTYTPVLMAITGNDDIKTMQKEIKTSTGLEIPEDALQNAKATLGNQKICAVKTNESWADCGTLNALYHTTMEIADGTFKLEDFERKNVLDSVNTKTGLIASSKEQKERIEKKYNIEGQVMVVPMAKPTDKNVIARNEGAIIRYSSKFPASKKAA